MKGKTVVLGVTGGIAVYKVPELISRLRKRGCQLEVIMTKAASEFVTPLTFQEISQNPVHAQMFGMDFNWSVEHIALAKKADLIAIIPATANIIAKLACGIADDLLTATVLAADCPKLVAPAMNSGMFQNEILQKNLNRLRDLHFSIVGPDCGPLLCGDEGIGRLATLEEIELMIRKELTIQDLTGESVLITAGGTKEPLDPVRYLGNRSSGKMGHALAEAAFCHGAQVLLVTAAEPEPTWTGISVFKVNTALEMRTEVIRLANQASIIIKAAAPADYRPAFVSEQKIKKTESELTLSCVLNPDILSELGQKKSKQQILVGFAAETESLEKNARAKLVNKNLDLIIANLVNQPDHGIGADTNQVTIISDRDLIQFPVMPKKILADHILQVILKYKRDRVISNYDTANR